MIPEVVRLEAAAELEACTGLDRATTLDRVHAAVRRTIARGDALPYLPELIESPDGARRLYWPKASGEPSERPFNGPTGRPAPVQVLSLIHI